MSRADDESQADYEESHVHAVYQAIAPHFSATRHSPWPLVKRFLLAQHPAAVGLDIGCGNGKYLGANPSVHILGCDRSAALVALAKARTGTDGSGQDSNSSHNNNNNTSSSSSSNNNNTSSSSSNNNNNTSSSSSNNNNNTSSSSNNNTSSSSNTTTTGSNTTTTGSHNSGTRSTPAGLLLADSLSLPFRPRSADFVLCIAVIHHLSTVSRRRAALAALLACLRPRDGRALVYVWALEQAGSRRGWDAACEQDTLVPWVMKKKKKKKKQQETQKTTTARKQKQSERGEESKEESLERSEESNEDAKEESHERSEESNEDANEDANEQTFHRYYHLYREGELEEDARAAGAEVCESGYERDNWWVLLRTRD